jgi:D-glycero-D-manno-heptose 1,7-bisphosphate phosphatase
MKIMFPAVFLDRDGVLIENRSDYVRDWSQVSIFPDTPAAISSLRDAGYKIVIVTNQSAVGRGLISAQTAEAINQRLVDDLHRNGGHIDAVYMCPHQPEDSCECRKPKPGLLLQAAEELSLDLKRSWMVGDAWSDLLAGRAANLHRIILVKTGRGNGQLLQAKPDTLDSYLVADDIIAAARVITSNLSDSI